MRRRWNQRKKGQGMAVHIIIRRPVPESDFGIDFFYLRLETTCALPVVRGQFQAEARVRATHIVAPSPELHVLCDLYLAGYPQRGAQKAQQRTMPLLERSKVRTVHDI